MIRGRLLVWGIGGSGLTAVSLLPRRVWFLGRCLPVYRLVLEREAIEEIPGTKGR